MPRLVVQSLSTGRFLVPGDGGNVEWSRSLREAGGGVVADMEAAHQLVQDWCDGEDMPTVIDLDRLGTSEDY